MNCLECKEYNHKEMYCPKFCKVIRGAMDELREYCVPVIRCKDCKYWLGNNHWCCYGMNTVADDYCSKAERKE